MPALTSRVAFVFNPTTHVLLHTYVWTTSSFYIFNPYPSYVFSLFIQSYLQRLTKIITYEDMTGSD